MTKLTDSEIIKLLGGITVVARMLDIKPPSVHAWLKDGIPDSRLVALAAQIELKSGGRFSRKQHWPEKFAIYWPELALAVLSAAPVSLETVVAQAVRHEPAGSLRAGVIRRQSARRASESATQRDRRAKGGPPFQSFKTGVA